MAAGTTDRWVEQRATPIESDVATAPRIAYVAYPSSLILRSANAVQTYATVRELRRFAPDCDVLIPRFGFRESRFTDLAATHLLRLPFNGGRHLIRSVVWSYAERTWFALRVCAWLARKRLTRSAPDILYVRDIVCAAWLGILAPMLGSAVVFEVHDLEEENRSANSGPMARWIARRLDRVAMGRAAGVVSLTEAFTPTVTQYRGRPSARSITVIPDAYDDGTYIPQERNAARRVLGLSPDAFIVAYTGLTFAYHGVDLLVDAFRLLADRIPDAHLLLVGGREGERDAIRRQIAGLGLEASVTVIPPQPVAAIPTYLAAADALVIPDTVTKASASPLKLFEYAAMARPIIAADLPALREILPGDAARYIAPANAHALADSLHWVSDYPQQAEAMAQRASEAVAGATYRSRAAAILSFCRQIADERA